MNRTLALAISALVAIHLLALGGAPRASATGQAAPPPAQPSVGLVSCWRAEGNGIDFAQINSGVPFGGTSFETGRVGQAFRFNGSTAVVMLGNPASLQLQNFTIEGWIKRSDAAHASKNAFDTGVFLSYGQNGYGFGIAGSSNTFSEPSGELFLSKIQVDEVGSGASGLVILDTQYHHVAVTKAGTQVIFYLDGVASTPINYLDNFTFTTSIGIGNRGDGVDSDFLGSVDELSVYKRALAPAEIQAIFQAGGSGKALAVTRTPVVAIPSPLPLSWWRGEGNPLDSGPSFNDGALAGGTTYTQGMVGHAFSFDGSTGYVDIPHNDNLNPSGPFSVEAWIKADPTQTSPDGLFMIADTSSGFTDGTGWLLQGEATHGDVGLFLGIGGSPAVSSFVGGYTTQGVLDNQWHHIVGVYDGAQISTYLDGTLNTTTPFTGTPAGNTRNAEIGRSWGGGTPRRYFHGAIDEVSYYNQALSAGDVLKLFNAGSVGKATIVVNTSSDNVDASITVTSLRKAILQANGSDGSPQAIGFNIANPPIGLIAQYPAEGDATDTINGNNGTLDNGTSCTSVAYGRAFSFDGIDDQVTIPHNAIQNTGGQLSIDAWIRPLSRGHGRPILQKRSAANVGGFTFETTDSPFGPPNGLEFAIWIGGTLHEVQTTSDALTIGVYQHVAATYNGNFMRVFVNGVKLGEAPVTGAIDATTDPMVIGRNVVATTFDFEGIIDTLEVYDRGLSPSEVLSLFHLGAGFALISPAAFVSLHSAEGNANDSVDGQPALFVGGVGFAPGKLGEAFDLNGLGRRVSCPDSPKWAIGAGDFTIGLWANLATVGTTNSLVGQAGFPNKWGFEIDQGHLCFNVVNGPAIGGNGVSIHPAPFAPEIRRWYHLAVTRAASKFTFYIDGSPVAAATNATTVPLVSAPLTIGYLGGTDYFHGMLDEVAIFHRALSAAEVRALSQAGTKLSSEVSSIALDSELPLITKPVVIDGYSQPGAQPNTNAVGKGLNTQLNIELNGSNFQSGASGLDIEPSGGGSVVRGLVINHLFGPGISISGSAGNTISGNYIGTDITGETPYGSSNAVSIVSAPGNVIGGITPADRNLLSATTAAMSIFNAPSSGTLVQGNIIGADAAGVTSLHSTIFGVELFGAQSNTIGGSAFGAGNLLSGNTGGGVLILNGASNNLVQGNFVGTDATGQFDLHNGGSGITVAASNNTIGGVGFGEGNTIAYNQASGVSVVDNPTTTTGVNILHNSIFRNVHIGIDLGSNSVTPNDPLDADSGPNNLQNFPQLINAASTITTSTLSIAIDGFLDSAPNTAYRIEFFASDVLSPTGYGEGQFYLGFQNVSTDGSGRADFSALLTAFAHTYQTLTATATDPGGNTSEFSPALLIYSPHKNAARRDWALYR